MPPSSCLPSPSSPAATVAIAPPTSPTTIASKSFSKAVAPHFDWIVIDSSPVLPVSDAVNLSRACDGVLLVARSGVTEFEDMQRSQAELKAAQVLGVVLNAVSHAPQAGSYYGYNREHEAS